MNHRSSSDSHLEIFARLLAELVNRLRLFHVENHHHEHSWPVCFHLGVQADLLAGLAEESGLRDLANFAQSLQELAVLGRDDPNQIPQTWSAALTQIAEFLDEMLMGIDAGNAPDQWLSDPRWERLISWFTNLGTPFLVMDQLEKNLLQWQDAWCDGSLDPKHEAELQERWIRLREFGDALFSSSTQEEDTSLLHWKGFTP
jgi:hypothetical protein